MIGSMRNTRGDDIGRANICGNRLTVPEAGFRGRAPRVVFCPSKAHRLTARRVERHGCHRSLFDTAQAFIHREIQCFLKPGCKVCCLGCKEEWGTGGWVADGHAKR